MCAASALGPGAPATQGMAGATAPTRAHLPIAGTSPFVCRRARECAYRDARRAGGAAFLPIFEAVTLRAAGGIGEEGLIVTATHTHSW